MASCGRRKSVWNSRRDLLSELPADVKERILEWLPIRDAARIALLSTHWRDVWLGHGRLVLDSDIFSCLKNGKGDKRVALVNMINDILLCRSGPVKKFTLHISSLDPKPWQCDLDRWFRFLSRNGIQELSISISHRDGKYKLPSCIVLCGTIKKLMLCGFVFDWPTNAGCIFPGVTSLVFRHVEFSDKVNEIMYNIPNLENLAFCSCEGINNFEISAPKLESLYAIGYRYPGAFTWFTIHLKAIKTLKLFATLLSCENVEVATLRIPTAINLQVIKLYCLSFANLEQLTIAMQLLKKSPNLCKLEIIALNDSCSSDDINAASRLLEDLNSCIINQDLKTLNTIKIESFSGSTPQMIFVKMLLSKSLALERVIIQESNDIDGSIAVKVLRELLHFPRASPKAQIMYLEYNST